MKKIGIYALVAMLAVTMLGCEKKSTDISSTDTKTEESASDKKEETKKDEVEDKKEDPVEQPTQPTEEPVQEPTQEPVGTEVEIYYGNSDATALTSEKIQVSEVSPEILWSELVKKGMVPADVTINSRTDVEKDGVKAMDLDLSSGFVNYLDGRGSSGEYMTMGSICNTFLKAYGCEKIRITVDGGELATGSAEYPGYMGMFP